VLKLVFINSKKIPVPVPVRTLGEALAWVEETLVPAGHTVTRVALDDRVIGDDAQAADLHARLTPESRLEIQVDSPVDLSVQTLDATRNLASVIVGGLKVLAVECWQAKSGQKPAELDSVANDLELVLDLLGHVAALVGPMQVDAAPLSGIQTMLKRDAVALAMAKANSDWKACARLLLNRLEPQLKELIIETETLQIRVMTQSGSAVAPTGSGRR
jgi:hypothetical protein